MVQRNGMRFDSQEFSIERTGRRKYSVPRLASAQGEEAARRAMPTSSVAGFVLRSGTGVGAEASHPDSQVPWRAAVGNKVRLSASAGSADVGTSPGWAEVWEMWPLFASPHVPHYIRLLFAMSRQFFRFIF